MQFNNPQLPPFWQWKRELPDSLIALIKQEAETMPFEAAQVGVEGGIANDPDTRVSRVCMLPSVHWLAGALGNYGAHANFSAGWGFSLSLPETCQITKYGIGEFYEFHTDNVPISAAPQVRKVSVACCITSADEYEGGEFEFKGIPPIKMDKGDIIAFPSGMLHRVKPVTAGERCSLVTWIFGPNVR